MPAQIFHPPSLNRSTTPPLQYPSLIQPFLEPSKESFEEVRVTSGECYTVYSFCYTSDRWRYPLWVRLFPLFESPISLRGTNADTTYEPSGRNT